ncbi:MAG: UDP-N-acetylmuramoyl-tripeptide--D-alanyl-D-alanine ligase [Acidobacteria bacterium]|nr:UDP-N-acetylmuramoyl-tripeptide--D-alanyl-D-alanine ligase [Acidobacteriota bacterium]
MTILVAGEQCNGVSTDTRTLQDGAAFVALRGEVHDGHDHVLAAFQKGARAAVVDHAIDGAGPQEICGDTLQWLQFKARTEREHWGGLVIGITGSAGKTTTKDAIAAVLSTRLRTGKTQGNFNNHIGVPLTLLNLDGSCEAAAVEIGMNHAGEIADLARIAQPRIGVVTNVGSAHIENLGSRDAIAAAKAELLAALPAGGVAVLNGDDERVRRMGDLHPGRKVYFGSSVFVPSEAAHVRAEKVEYSKEGTSFEVMDVGSFYCPLPGRGGLMAALAALGVARALDFDLTELKDAIANLVPAKNRLNRLERDGMVIWDDCYNSNPEAAEMMLDLLAATPARRQIAVLGEMLELGHWSEDLHREVGRYAARSGISVLIGIRGAAKALVDAGLDAGLSPGAAHFFDEPREAGRYVKSLAQAGDALLFKGSRGTRVELALEAFLN